MFAVLEKDPGSRDRRFSCLRVFWLPGRCVKPLGNICAFFDLLISPLSLALWWINPETLLFKGVCWQWQTPSAFIDIELCPVERYSLAPYIRADVEKMRIRQGGLYLLGKKPDNRVCIARHLPIWRLFIFSYVQKERGLLLDQCLESRRFSLVKLFSQA